MRHLLNWLLPRLVFRRKYDFFHTPSRKEEKKERKKKGGQNGDVIQFNRKHFLHTQRLILQSYAVFSRSICFKVTSSITSCCHLTQGLTCVAVRSRPAFQAGFVSIVVTRIMPEELVSGPTKLVAAETVVVLVAADPDLVFKLGYGAVVRQLLPLRAGVDHARMRGFFYQPPIYTLKGGGEAQAVVLVNFKVKEREILIFLFGSFEFHQMFGPERRKQKHPNISGMQHPTLRFWLLHFAPRA